MTCLSSTVAHRDVLEVRPLTLMKSRPPSTVSALCALPTTNTRTYLKPTAMLRSCDCAGQIRIVPIFEGEGDGHECVPNHREGEGCLG